MLRDNNQHDSTVGKFTRAAFNSHPLLDKCANELVAQKITELGTLNHSTTLGHSNRKGIFQLRRACRQRKLLVTKNQQKPAR